MRTSGLKTRMLALIGKNLDLGGETYLVLSDRAVLYRRLTLPPNIQGAVTRAAVTLSEVEIAADEEVVTVRADLEPGVRGSVKQILVNGEPMGWGLVFNNRRGRIQFLRAGASPNDTPEHTFYSGEAVHVGVKAFNDNYPLDNLEIILEAEKYPATTAAPRNEARRLGRLRLRRTDDAGRGQNFALSPPILLTQAGAAQITPEPGEIRVTLQPGERIVARPADRFALLTIPPVVSADVRDKPKRSRLWQTALDKVSQCPSFGGDPKADGFLSQASRVFENWILVDAIANRWRDGSLLTDRSATRRIKVSKGDHAAVILIRDELLPIVKAQNETLRPYLDDGPAGQRKAMRYWSDAKSIPGAKDNAFWKLRTYSYSRVDIPTGTTITVGFPLSETFDVDALRRKTHIKNKVDTQDLINRAVSRNLHAQYRETNEAIRRGRDSGTCYLEELLVIAGQKAEPAVARLLPDLVKQENGRWRPDAEARGYVKSVHFLGEAVRAQDAYAEIDNAYKSMAVALAVAPVAVVGSALSASGQAGAAWTGTAGAAIAAGADIFDMAYFGRKGVEEYFKGEEDYTTALGLSPVIGPDIVGEAAAGRDSGLAAAIGVLAPGVSGLAGFSALDDISKINKGRALLRGEGGLKDLCELSNVQKAEVAAYYKRLKESDASITSRLSKQEKADLEQFDDFIEKSTGVSRAKNRDPASDIGGAPENAGVESPVATEPPPMDPSVDPEIPHVSSEQGALPDKIDPRQAETYIDPDELWKLGPEERFDYPYRSKFGTGDAKSDGTVIENVNPRDFSLLDGAEIIMNDGEKFKLGETIDVGGFRRVYRGPENSDIVYKVTSYEAAEAKGLTGDNLDRFFHDSDVGRELLTTIEKNSPDNLLTVAEQKGELIIVDDPFRPGRKYVITKEDNIQDVVRVRQPDGSVVETKVTSAKERFALRESKSSNEAERLTIQLAIRKLNQEGVIWTDHKLANLDVVPDAASPTGYKVDFFDHDAFRIAKGNTPYERYVTARKSQQIFDQSMRGQNSYHKMLASDLPDFDHTIFDREMIFLSTLGVNQGRTQYLELDKLSPEEFRKVLKGFENTQGKQIPYSPPMPN